MGRHPICPGIFMCFICFFISFSSFFNRMASLTKNVEPSKMVKFRINTTGVGVMVKCLSRLIGLRSSNAYDLSPKLMRLVYLIGFGSTIERSPLNSASLSMLPWPKPAGWPSVPSDASSEVLDIEKTILQVTPRIKHFGIQSKPLSLEPSSLLPDASSVDTTRLAELFVAAEHALHVTISDPDLRKFLSSLEEFEKKYLDLSKGAAGNYYHAWWKRHGVIFDNEIASVYFKHKNYEQAESSYEKSLRSLSQ